jgi:ParB-like chromosome segregation protein Spo0J
MREGRVAAVRAATLGSTAADVILPDRELDDRGAAQGGSGGQVTQVVLCASLKAAHSPRLDGESLDQLAVLAETGVYWPPVLVHRQTMRVIDGMHRLRAAQLRGDQSVEVKFFDGDAHEAFIAGVQANSTHGLPLTLADRKAAAQRILGWQPHQSDRWIGQVTGLAAGTVAAIRRGAGTADPRGLSRLGRDGRVRPVNAADRRLKAQQEISARPEASLREIGKAARISPATAKNVRDRLRRGDDLIPRADTNGRSERQAIAGRPQNDSNTRGESPDHERSLDWSLQRLMRDPSLPYSEPGRRLLRCLGLHARGPSAAERLIDAVPAHCGYIIVTLARHCARQWLGLADALERRANDRAGA